MEKLNYQKTELEVGEQTFPHATVFEAAKCPQLERCTKTLLLWGWLMIPHYW